MTLFIVICILIAVPVLVPAVFNIWELFSTIAANRKIKANLERDRFAAIERERREAMHKRRYEEAERKRKEEAARRRNEEVAKHIVEEEKRRDDQKRKEEEERRKEEEREKARIRAEEFAALEKLKISKILEELDELPDAPIVAAPLQDSVVPALLPEHYKAANFTVRSDLQMLGSFVVISIETTGLEPHKHDVVELAAIRYRDFRPVEKFHTLLKPRFGIKARAKEINHISAKMVEDKPFLYQVIPSFQSFIGNDNLLGHYLSFDLKFLLASGLRVGEKKKTKFFDTLQLAKRQRLAATEYWDDEDCYYTPKADSYKLGDLCDYYCILQPEERSAMSDCYAIAELYKELLGEKLPVSDYIEEQSQMSTRYR